MDQTVAHTHQTSTGEIERVLLYGLTAEFDDAHQLIGAANKTREAGYKKIDAYAPFPVEGLSDALGHRDHYIIQIMLGAGVVGGLTGFGLQYWATLLEYPLNIGGRPLYAWPSWIPITFELTVLFAALSGIFGMFAINGLPEPYHPMFDAPNFDRASSDRFFLTIESRDPKFDREKTRQFLESLGAMQVSEVELKK